MFDINSGHNDRILRVHDSRSPIKESMEFKKQIITKFKNTYGVWKKVCPCKIKSL